MTNTLAQTPRDSEIWGRWIGGETQQAIAHDLGLAQSTISDACSRFASTIPEPDKRAVIERVLGYVDTMFGAWSERGLRDPNAAKVMFGVIDRVTKLRDLDPATKIQGQIHHAVSWTPGPPVDQVLAQAIQDGRVRPRAELTRPDRPGP